MGKKSFGGRQWHFTLNIDRNMTRTAPFIPTIMRNVYEKKSKVNALIVISVVQSLFSIFFGFE